jgi:hypothetical protein
MRAFSARQGYGGLLLALGAGLTLPAMDAQRTAEILRHAPLCLGGKGEAALGPALVLGHCGLCWAAAGAFALGLLLLGFSSLRGLDP